VTDAAGAWSACRTRIVAVAAVVALATAPLHAQPADACVSGPGTADSTGLARWTCTGAGFDAAVRFSVSFPADWAVVPPGDGGLRIEAVRGGARISVAAEDQLHAPRTRSDTLGFWMRATRIGLGREPTLHEVGTFRRATQSPTKARRAVTRAQQRDTALLAMAHGLSAAHEGRRVLVSAAEVRPLAGAPAGWLSETFEEDGAAWRSISYVTVRDAVVFIATLTAPRAELDAAFPSWERAMATLEMRTDRSASATPP
jgi:hypothetical protein